MKTLIRYAGMPALFLTIILTVNSCTKESGQGNTDRNNGNSISTANLQEQVINLPIEPLSTAELNTLSLMREEEKLARDVYLALYSKWNATVFSNISKSEQTHMDAILLLLNRYDLPDPAGANAVGVFNNATSQTLYTQLVKQGSISILNAYMVGATIEDLDIFDLTNALSTIDNQDIRLVYDNLSKGSRNHMRSFNKNIEKVGGAYTPQYITQAAFDAIISSGMETGY